MYGMRMAAILVPAEGTLASVPSLETYLVASGENPSSSFFPPSLAYSSGHSPFPPPFRFPRRLLTHVAILLFLPTFYSTAEAPACIFPPPPFHFSVATSRVGSFDTSLPPIFLFNPDFYFVSSSSAAVSSTSSTSLFSNHRHFESHGKKKE